MPREQGEFLTPRYFESRPLEGGGDRFFASAVFQILADGFRIEQVAEFPGADRTDFNTGRITAGFTPCPLNAEGAFFNHTLITRPVAKVVGLRIDFIFCNVRISPIETTGTIRAGSHTVPAADAPIIINDHYPIRFFPGCPGGADLDTRRIFTLLTLDRHVEIPIFRYFFRRIILIGRFQISYPFFTFFKLKHANVMDLRISRLVVFPDASIHTTPATYATGQIQPVAEKCIS